MEMEMKGLDMCEFGLDVEEAAKGGEEVEEEDLDEDKHRILVLGDNMPNGQPGRFGLVIAVCCGRLRNMGRARAGRLCGLHSVFLLILNPLTTQPSLSFCLSYCCTTSSFDNPCFPMSLPSLWHLRTLSFKPKKRRDLVRSIWNALEQIKHEISEELAMVKSDEIMGVVVTYA